MARHLKKSEIENQLLNSLPDASLERLRPHLEKTELRHGSVLFEMEEPVAFMVFPGPDALVSLLSVNEDGELTEVGIVGHEGTVGFSHLLGATKSSHRALVQMPGKAWRIDSAVANKLFASDPGLRSTLLRFVNFMILQISQTALCNRLHTVEERLARWLLMSEERVRHEQLPLTHEMLSHMLGTRRSTVTLAATSFQESGLIRYQRGKITIVNRRKLKTAACPCFTTHQKHYHWLQSGEN